jgi:hypothetical protein
MSKGGARMKEKLLLVFTAALLTWSAMGGVPAKAADEDLKFVTTDELKAMIDAKEDFALINALSPLEFTETKIIGSINIPYDRLKRGKASLPDDKVMTLVFYCKGPK